MNEDDFDISCTDNFVCPYCGYEERDIDEIVKAIGQIVKHIK